MMRATTPSMAETGELLLAGNHDHDVFIIGGERRRPVADSGVSLVSDPATGQIIGHVPVGTAADVDVAVAAAKVAGRTWADSSVDVRAALLSSIAAGVREWREEIAGVITAEMGAPRDNARDVQTDLAADVFDSYARIVREFTWQEQIGGSLVVHEPIGVVGAITPWNYPLYLAALKVAAAIAAGCSVVLKPSDEAPLDAFLLAGIIDDAAAHLDAPAGLLNIVTGPGTVVGAAISTHPDVRAVSFTGSTGAGRTVSAAAAATVKRVGLELGGKSAAIICDDVTDLRETLEGALADVFYNSGQTCTACTRILVPTAWYDDAVSLSAEIARTWRLGDPALPGDHIGPIANARQYATVQRLLTEAENEGARLVAGGMPGPDDVPAGLTDGFWVLPTVLADVAPDMTVAREEIFGPVAVVMPYADIDDAITIANDSEYGLSGAVWSADPDRAVRIGRRIETGRVVINGGPFNVNAPTGGVKQSGNGRELGVHGLLEYLEVKVFQR